MKTISTMVTPAKREKRKENESPYLVVRRGSFELFVLKGRLSVVLFTYNQLDDTWSRQ